MRNSKSDSRRKRSLILAAALFVMLVGALWFWFGRGARAPAIEHIVLISIDTCRADRLSCYGYERGTTPHIDAVAGGATLFENVLSPVPMTLPAHATMLTGTNPPYHGSHDNLRYRLAPSNVTLAESLRPHGFRTGAIVSTFVLDAQFGLDQGFESYHDRFEQPAARPMAAERKGDETTRLALKWLDAHKDERFFLFLYYYDPHDDYEPPEPFAGRFADDPYGGEIAFTDHCVGQVIDKLKTLGLYDSTLLIITADHGEMLGEHGEPAHAYFIYQSALRVPLIIKPPGAGPAQRLQTLAGIVDVVPTVCSLVGIDPPPNVSGMDLSAALHGHELPDDDRVLFCESFTPANYDCNTLVGVVGERWKYIRTTRPELYDLKEDPQESNNLAEQQPRIAKRMRARLEQILEEQWRDDAEARVNLDAESLRKLESIGYAGGGGDGGSGEFLPDRDDPKDFIAFHNTFGQVPDLIAQRRHDEAAALCRQLLEQRPRFVLARMKLMQIASARDEHPAALAHGLQILDIDAEHARALNGIGVALAALGRTDEAIERYEQALKVEPGLSDAHVNYGIALASKGRHDEAIQQYHAALERNPKSAEAHCNLGVALSALGKHAEAVEDYQRALALKRDYADAHYNLGLAFGRLGRADDAIQAYQAAIEASAEHANAHYNLGMTLVKGGRDADAVACFESYVALEPQRALGHLNLGVACTKAGRRDDAIKAFTKAAELDPQGQTGQNARRYVQILQEQTGVKTPSE